VKKWKDMTNGRPFLVKGIQCAEDAIKAVEAGCDGVVASNHAGRQVDGAIGSLEALPEVSTGLWALLFLHMIVALTLWTGSRR
jgi:isopentenyl diphosphate isomerase/L-lactate dehydrogenase-like FMN-dependent dehydrogenase